MGDGGHTKQYSAYKYDNDTVDNRGRPLKMDVMRNDDVQRKHLETNSKKCNFILSSVSNHRDAVPFEARVNCSLFEQDERWIHRGLPYLFSLNMYTRANCTNYHESITF